LPDDAEKRKLAITEIDLMSLLHPNDTKKDKFGGPRKYGKNYS